MTRAKVLEMLCLSKSYKLRASMKDKSINDIFNIMKKNNLIDNKGYFLPKFINLEGKLEEVKFVGKTND